MPANSERPDGAPASETTSRSTHPADLSVWLIWAVVMLVAIAVLPFAARSQDVVRAIANMCGFTLK